MADIDAIRDDVQAGKIRDMQQPDGNDDAKGHAGPHEQRVHSPGGSGNDVVVQKIINGVDERNARNDEQCAGNDRMPRRSR